MPQRPDIEKMQTRLQAALTKNPRVHELAYQDLMNTFMRLHLQGKASPTVRHIMKTLAESEDLLATETDLTEFLGEIIVDGQGLLDVIKKAMANRAQIIYDQVGHFFKPEQLIIDWGCGDGQVTDLLHQHGCRNIIGYDIRRFPAPGIQVSIRQFDGQNIPIENGAFDAGLMTNVAHHEANNGRILHELARVIKTGGRLVVIETVPINKDPDQFERTFVGDYVWNRIFHTADIPVPGTYETEEGWVRRFKEVGFELEELDEVNPLPLGYDQPTIRDWHTRLVFRRK